MHTSLGSNVTFLLFSFPPFSSFQPADGVPGSQWTSRHNQNVWTASMPLSLVFPSPPVQI